MTRPRARKKRTITFNIDVGDLAKIDQYAANLERDRTFVLNQAVHMLIAHAEQEAAEDEAAMRGPTYTLEEVMQRLKAGFPQEKAS